MALIPECFDDGQQGVAFSESIFFTATLPSICVRRKDSGRGRSQSGPPYRVYGVSCILPCDDRLPNRDRR